MDNIRIVGGRPLRGSVAIRGAKNAALPLLTACLLADGEHRLRNVPGLRDIRTMTQLLRHLGVEVQADGPSLRLQVHGPKETHAPYELVKQMRASVLVLGPLLARHGHARVSMPGGCAIGARPIDQHLLGLQSMGAKVSLSHGDVDVTVPTGRLRGAEIRFAVPTVTGTENLLCAAALADGTTVICNAAREPEVVELAQVLSAMGARIEGAGTDVITIVGREALQPIDHSILADRIEAGTYMAAIAATGGDALVEHAPASHLQAVIDKFRQAGVGVEPEGDGLRVVGHAPIGSVDVCTAPYPDFPTDMQAQFMVLMCLGRSISHITETVFENRFMHVAELNRMGADIRVQGHTASVHGVGKLQGARVMATDLRASASLVIAGLVAEGTTEVLRVYHLDRGYEQMELRLAALGADVQRVRGNA